METNLFTINSSNDNTRSLVEDVKINSILLRTAMKEKGFTCAILKDPEIRFRVGCARSTMDKMIHRGEMKYGFLVRLCEEIDEDPETFIKRHEDEITSDESIMGTEICTIYWTPDVYAAEDGLVKHGPKPIGSYTDTKTSYDFYIDLKDELEDYRRLGTAASTPHFDSLGINVRCVRGVHYLRSKIGENPYGNN